MAYANELETVQRMAVMEQLQEPWFDEPPISVGRRTTSEPPVSVGEFIGDAVADAWLR